MCWNFNKWFRAQCGGNFCLVQATFVYHNLPVEMLSSEMPLHNLHLDSSQWVIQLKLLNLRDRVRRLYIWGRLGVDLDQGRTRTCWSITYFSWPGNALGFPRRSWWALPGRGRSHCSVWCRHDLAPDKWQKMDGWVDHIIVKNRIRLPSLVESLMSLRLETLQSFTQ